MIISRQSRQDVAQFTSKLNAILAKAPGKARLFIDKGGASSRNVRSKNDEERMMIYGHERFDSVARVLALFEVLRASQPVRWTQPVRVAKRGAAWQAFGGHGTMNACHTCPTQVTLDGHLPTLKTRSQALQRHLVVEFAHCMLMPRVINEVDIAIDDQYGKAAFIAACEVVLNEPNARWRDGVKCFSDRLTQFIGPLAREVQYGPQSTYVADLDTDATRIEMVLAYYEGMTSPLNERSVDQLAECVVFRRHIQGTLA